MSNYFWEDKDKIISEVLQPLFKLGLSVTKACKYAGIPQRTVQDWIEKDDELRLKINVWQNEISLQARKNIAEKMTDKNSDRLLVSQWWLRMKERDEFTERTETVQSSVTYEELKQMQLDNIKEGKEIERSRIIRKGLYDQIKSL
jgi:hypothetical protein